MIWNARVITQSCCGLAYLNHVLELMLHEVLEDEATDNSAIVHQGIIVLLVDVSGVGG